MLAWGIRRLVRRATDRGGRRGFVVWVSLTFGFVLSRALAEEGRPPSAPVPEIELIFGEIGISVRLRTGSPSAGREAALWPLAVRIVLVPQSGEGWRLSPRAMGAVMGKELTTRTLYVFFPSVLRGIGDETGVDERVSKPGELHRLALALARVVAHEVVHAIDPDLPHVEELGIMNARLGPRMLQRGELSFTASTAARLTNLLEQRALLSFDRTNAPVAGLLSK